MGANALRAVVGLCTGGCAETSVRLSGYLDRDLPRLRVWRVRAHLAGCEQCRSVLRSLTSTVALLRLLGHSPQPGDDALVDSVLARIETSDEQRRTHE